jgi:predicted aconitase with swiveling domain
MKKIGLAVIAVGVAGSLALGSLAAAETAKPAAPASGVVAALTVELTATVVEIDHKTRTVTLKVADGKTETFVVDEAARNLDQVQKGDVVVVTYAEALAYEVKTGGTTGSTTVAAAAKPGAKPAGVLARETTVTVTITAIDEKAPSVTFKGPAGNTRTIKVKHPEKLKTVKVGDQVELTYTEALALTVEKAKK